MAAGEAIFVICGGLSMLLIAFGWMALCEWLNKKGIIPD